MTDNHSAVTAAELDELHREAVYYSGKAGNDYPGPLLDRLATTLAALRRERDEARRSLDTERTAILRKNAEADRMSDANAQMASALREIESMEPATQETTLAHQMAQIARDALTPASQEAAAHDGCCNCETCIEARSRGARYKGEGNTPMQKEDYNGSCQ